MGTNALRATLALALGIACGPAVAQQRTPVFQFGTATPGDLSKFVTQGGVSSVGGLTGDANGVGVNPFAVYDRGDLGLCAHNAPSGGPYSALCLGHDSTGAGVISLESYGGAPVRGMKFRIEGGESVIPGTITGVPVAASTAALQAMSTNEYSTVIRAGVLTRGDADPLVFNASGSACPLNAGAGDGGSEVPSADGGCWIASFPSGQVDPNQFDGQCRGQTTQAELDAGIAHDCAPAINAAAAVRFNGRGLTVRLRPGNYYITDAVTIGAGQWLIGAGRGLTTIWRDQSFSPTAAGGIVLRDREELAPSVYGIHFFDKQPLDQNDRNNFANLGACTSGPGGTGCRYSPAIFSETANRFRLMSLRFSSVWDGISISNNTQIGGFVIDDIEMGALNRGVLIDKVRDFANFTRYHFWEFGWTDADGLSTIYRDGNTIAVQFGSDGVLVGGPGRIDGLNVQNLNIWRGRVQVRGDGTWLSINNINLDGNSSTLEIYGSDPVIGVKVTNLYTTGYATDGVAHNNCKIDIKSTSANVQIANFTTTNSPAGAEEAAICHRGGSLVLSGGQMHSRVDGVAIKQTGGRFVLSGSLFRTAGVMTQPLIRQTGGYAVVVGNSLDPVDPSSVPAFDLTDTVNNYFANNALHGRRPVDPSLGYLGYYDFGDYQFPLTVTPEFVTNGDFAPVNQATFASYYRRGNWIDYSFRVDFDANSYTTASDAFRFKTDTPQASVVHGTGCTIHVLSNFAQINAPACYHSGSDGFLRVGLTRLVADSAAINFTTLQVPAGRTGFRADVSGRYRVR